MWLALGMRSTRVCVRQRRSKEEEAWRGEGSRAELENACVLHQPGVQEKDFKKELTFQWWGDRARRVFGAPQPIRELQFH